jgi:nucleoside-diphosphate-sugar epimerase
MKILITGHQGFIGKNLKVHLENLNYTVLGIDLKSGQNILDCDLPDCDLVVHLAGASGVRESINDPMKYWVNNVEGTKRILSHYTKVRVLVASSSSQYEPHLNPYAASKHVIESIPHPNVCFMRLHTVYGPVPREGMFFDKLLKGTLEYVTDHERDFIHIDDVCEAITLLLNVDIKGPLDIGTGVSIKISDLRADLPLTHGLPYERKKTLAYTLPMKSLGFLPKRTIQKMIGLSGTTTSVGQP